MPDHTPSWDPAQYLRHAGHRARPFADLLARVPELPGSAPPRVADLGCGPGNVTVLLAGRWPTAHITGYDNSPEMLDKAVVDHAGPTAAGGRVDFAHADVRTWTPGEPYDLIVSNATLQWVPGHAERFADWVAALRPGGTFAFQVPGNFSAPSHRLMRDLAGSARWKDRLAEVLRHEDAVLAPGAYLEKLTALGCTADVWETTYIHLLQGEDPVLDWVKGTGLRPFLEMLETAERKQYLAEYTARVASAYLPQADGKVLFRFPRIFIVAVK